MPRYIEESTTDTGSDVFGFQMPNKKARDGQPREKDRYNEEETRRMRRMRMRMRKRKRKRMAKVGWLKGYLVQDGYLVLGSFWAANQRNKLS